MFNFQTSKPKDYIILHFRVKRPKTYYFRPNPMFLDSNK